jgi:transposase-like protein
MVCIFCQNKSVVKNGKRLTGEQNYKCNHCKKQFIVDYSNPKNYTTPLHSNNVWIRWFRHLDTQYV